MVGLVRLESELVRAGANGKQVSATKAKAKSAAPAAIDAEVVSLAGARALADARKASGGTGMRATAGLTRRIFAARAPQEIVRLVRGRVAAGATDPRWKAWHEAGGVPEGQRHMLLFLTGCLVVETMPMSELTAEKVDEAVLDVGRLIVAADWLRESWIKGQYGVSLVARAVAAGRGETEVWRGRVKDPRYMVGKARVVRELGARPEEILAYGLKSLATDRDRLAAERIESGVMPLAETQASNAKKARKAKKLLASGSSQRAAAKAVGLDEKQLRRILKNEACPSSVPREERGQGVVALDGVDPTSLLRAAR